MKRSLLALGAVCAITVTSARPADAEPRALLIAINDYAGNVDNLSATHADAHLMRRHLVESGRFTADQIRMLTDQEATLAGITQTVRRWLIHGTNPGDRVFLYYSGHGAQATDRDGDEPDGLDEVLVPYDAVADPARPVQFPDDQLSEILDALRDRQVTVVVDACHSGTIARSGSSIYDQGTAQIRERRALIPEYLDGARTRGTAPDPRRARERTLVEGRTRSADGPPHLVWTAVGPNQVAYEDTRLGHGIFTNAYVRGLGGAADLNGNGRITAAELLDYTRTESNAWCQNTKLCRDSSGGLTPDLDGPKTLVLAEVAAPAGSQGPANQQPNAADAPPNQAANAGEAPPNQAANAGGAPPNQMANAGGEPPVPQPTPTNGVASDLLGTRNPANLRVDVLPQPDLRAGQTVRFRVRAHRPGWLVLLDLAANDQLVQLYPNRFVSAEKRGWNWIAAGKTLTVPDAYYGFDFTADPDTLGRGLVIALLIEDELALHRLLQRHATLSPIQDPRQYLSDLADSLRSLQVTDANYVRSVTWSVAYRDYRVRN